MPRWPTPKARADLKELLGGKAWVRTLPVGGVDGLGLRLGVFGSEWFCLVRNWFRLVLEGAVRPSKPR